MVGGGVYEVEPGETVDATEMMLCLAESLADIGDFDPEDVIERYRAWFESHPRHVSLTVRAALISYRAGTHWDLASRRAFEILGGPRAGNGSLIRCAPVGLRYSGRRGDAPRGLRRDSTLTHFDRLAGWSCAAFNDLLAAALHGDLAEEVPAIAATFDDEDMRVSTTAARHARSPSPRRSAARPSCSTPCRRRSGPCCAPPTSSTPSPWP